MAAEGAARGRAQARSRARARRRRRRDHLSSSSEEEEEDERSEEDPQIYERQFFWTCYRESGFPNRVNHAVASHRDADGSYYLYSVGGYHADDDERTVVQADTAGGPFFRSSPIDIHCLDVDNRTWTEIVVPQGDRVARPFDYGPKDYGPKDSGLSLPYFFPGLFPPPPARVCDAETYSKTRIPGCRYGHTVCQHGGRLYMYGGRNDEDGSFSNVDCYDIAQKTWVKLYSSGEYPSSRDGHACTSVGVEMFIHGGFSASDMEFSGDLYAFNMETHTWRKLPNKGHKVQERDFHTATAVNNKIVTFGGRSDYFAPVFTASDVYDRRFYYYDLERGEWVKVVTSGYRVKGRRSHCAARIGSSIIYFGGYNANLRRHFGDVFMVNTDSWHITEIRPFGNAPCQRRRVGCALVGSELIICGGTSPIEIERGGRKREILHDHNDMYILHLMPTLEVLCMMVLIKEQVSLSALPPFLQKKTKSIQMPFAAVRPHYENLG